jgi:hypothetical protein
MDPTFDIKGDAFRRSLAETIAWCSNREIIATVEESEDVKKRRILGQQAGELTSRAFKERHRFWNRIFRRDYTRTRLWRRGMDLYRQADLGSLAPLMKELRSPTVRPSGSLAEARTEQAREEIVRSVVVARSDFVGGREPSCDANAGKLLVYAPDENLADGAAQHTCQGFFDGDNVPPWDTWVALSHGILLSWVPPRFVGLAQSGIDVNPECCIWWMDSERGSQSSSFAPTTPD